MADTWVQHTAADHAQAIADELPTGPAWPRDADSELMAWCAGCAETWGDVSARAGALLVTESDPRSADEMLPDWERAFGLPDACVAEPLTITDRRKALVNRMVALGRQDRAFFEFVADALGYKIRIREYSPFMAGVSRAGDTRPVAPLDPTDIYPRWVVGPPEIRFYWTVFIFGIRQRWFRAGTGQAGVDPMVRFGLATDLECVIRRWKPAHTLPIFDYGFASIAPPTFSWFRAGQSHAGTDPMVTIAQTGGIVDT